MKTIIKIDASFVLEKKLVSVLIEITPESGKYIIFSLTDTPEKIDETVKRIIAAVLPSIAKEKDAAP